MFVNEKFTVDAEVNRRNSLLIEYNPSNVSITFETKNPASLIVCRVVESDGDVMGPHFIESDFKINSNEYLDILKHSLVASMEFELDNVMLIQDTTPKNEPNAT